MIGSKPGLTEEDAALLVRHLRGWPRARGRGWVAPKPWDAAVSAAFAGWPPEIVPIDASLAAWRPVLEDVAAHGWPGPVWPDPVTWRKIVTQRLGPVVAGVPDPASRAAQVQTELAANHISPAHADTPIWSNGYPPRPT